MMEKIKDALAKAKSENVQVKAISKVPDIQHHTSFSAIENELGKISYSDASIIQLDPVHLEKNRVLAHLKNDPNSGIFDSLRTQILHKMEENNWRTMAIVSPTPESGKTLISINLAISIAQQPQKTAILVDFDLRRPKVASYLGMHPEKSLNEYLLNKANLQEIMFNPGIPRLVVLPTMRPVSKPAEMLSSNIVTSLIHELRERYESRIVIFDLPPVLNSDDAMVLLPQVDCILLVVAGGTSTQAEIEETLYRLPKENLLGVVLNREEVESKPYYY